MKKLSIFWFSMSFVASVFCIQCGVFVGNPADQDGGSVDADETVPSDSTGNTSDMTLTLSADASATLVQGDTLELPNGLSINYGKLVVSRLRILPTDAETEFERKIDTGVSGVQQGHPDGNDSLLQEKSEALRAIEEEYDALIAEAATDEEEEALREAEDEARAEIEAEFAEIEKGEEDDEDLYEEENDPSLKLPDDYEYDLLAGTVSPEIDSFTTLDGTYERLELELRPSRTTTDTTLINRSIVVEGTVEVSGETRWFEFESRSPIQLSLRGTGELDIDDDEVNDLVIKFALGAWFQGVDLSLAQVGPRGDIRINEQLNKPMYDQIIKNIRRSTKFGEDDDDDGILEDDELAGDGEEDVADDDDEEEEEEVVEE